MVSIIICHNISLWYKFNTSRHISPWYIFTTRWSCRQIWFTPPRTLWRASLTTSASDADESKNHVIFADFRWYNTPFYKPCPSNYIYILYILYNVILNIIIFLPWKRLEMIIARIIPHRFWQQTPVQTGGSIRCHQLVGGDWDAWQPVLFGVLDSHSMILNSPKEFFRCVPSGYLT